MKLCTLGCTISYYKLNQGERALDLLQESLEVWPDCKVSHLLKCKILLANADQLNISE